MGECLPRMKARGLDTHSKFAFGSEFTPASTDTSKLMEQLLKPMAGDTEEHIPLLRLLWWESWGIATHDAKRQAEATDSDRPRRLGPQELAARRKATIDKLSGLRITKDLEVSDQLITECVGMGDRSKLLYIPWEVCTTMELEVVGQRKDETFDKKSVDLATELKVDLAIRRRGLAMDMGDILDWDEHEKLREELMTAWAATPPPGYAKLTVAQVKRADEIAFTLLAKATAATGIKRVDGRRPLDTAMAEVLRHRDFGTALTPLPSPCMPPAMSGKRPAEETSAGEGLSRRQRKALRAADAAASGQRRPQAASWSVPPKGKGKGGGKDKGRGSYDKLPLQLRVPGATGVDDDNVPICYGYALGTCSAAPPGGRCPKGKHVCILKSCRKSHSYIESHSE